MDYKQYTFVGWVAIVNAIATVPIIVMSIFLEQVSQYWAGINSILVLLAGVTSIVNVYIFYKFRKLLNIRFDFHNTDRIILLIILINICLGFLNITRYMFPSTESVMKIIIMVLFVPFGISFIVFAIQLLKLKNNLFGFLKPYAYTTIAVGVCVSTVILFVVGVLIGVAGGLMQGMIFLKSAEEVEFV
jgi:hypothetical protein